MIRSQHVLAALACAATFGAGCNAPTCGPGTKQVQQANGTVRCVPADAPVGSGTIPCDVDGGAQILGGICRTRVVCGPNTQAVMLPDGTIDCQGTGMGVGSCPPCSPPGKGNICITGKLYDFSTNAQVMPGGTMMNYGAYEPTAFLAGNTTALAMTTSSDGCFTFPKIPTPASGLIALATKDAGGMYALTGVGATIADNTSYQIDVYRVASSTVASWTAGSNGVDYAKLGAYVALYYDDAVPSATTLTVAADTHPMAGVQIQLSGATITTPRYFDPTRDMIVAADTATSAVGGAVVPPQGGLQTFTASGGTCASGACKWESQPGSTTSGVVFIARFHNCNHDAASMAAASCQ